MGNKAIIQRGAHIYCLSLYTHIYIYRHKDKQYINVRLCIIVLLAIKVSIKPVIVEPFTRNSK